MNQQSDKKREIIYTIENRIAEINKEYRHGPSLYFYQKTIKLRKKFENIKEFIKNSYNLEIIYATLVSWDMNMRGAKMRYFEGSSNCFKEQILSRKKELRELEELGNKSEINHQSLIKQLKLVYKKLSIMESRSKIVSNSKLLHFLFPTLLIPVDRTHTLKYFFGNTGDSFKRYCQIIEFSLGIMDERIAWENYFDDQWNLTKPKIIDNAIMLIQGERNKKDKRMRK